LIVVILLAIVAVVAGGLVWYKQQPQALAPALNDENGVMLLIPAGPFVYGADKKPGVAPAFYIDRTEVTNRMYAEFCHATHREFPPDLMNKAPNLPVTNITIEDAASFAKWASKRLPDALEWEKAFRGSDGRLYPWGNTPDMTRANIGDANPGPVQADSMPEGGSPYNILHMMGNVAEFTRTQASVPEGSREALYEVRGGSYRTPPEDALPWKSRAVNTSFRAPDVGFRCVRDLPRR
jgi:formylglycine-generating enzyme required for sulfatase activity